MSFAILPAVQLNTGTPRITCRQS